MDGSTPDKLEQSVRDEIDEGVIISNLHLLELKLVSDTPYWKIDKKTNERLHAIKLRESRRLENGDETGIVIEYNTKTGQIMFPTKNFETGDFSRFHSWVIQKAGTKTILLYQSPEAPPIHALNAAMMGEEDTLADEGHKILPQRIVPGQEDLMGPQEPWGKSQFVQTAHGDMVFLRTIQKFNEKFGPPR